MSERTKQLLIVAGVLLLGVAVYLSRHQLIKAWRLLTQVDWRILLLIPVVQAVNYFSVAKTHQTTLRIFDESRASLRKHIELSFALNFVNFVAPSVGASGVSFFSYSLTRDGIPSGKSSLVQMSRYILTSIAFIGVLAAASLYLYFTGNIAQITVRIILLLVGLIIVSSGLVVFVLSNKEWLNRSVHWLFGVADKLGVWFRQDDEPLVPHETIQSVLEEFHEGFDILLSKKDQLGEPLWWSFWASVAEVTTVYVVFLAFGVVANPGVVTIGYGMANVAGVVTVVPGNVGLFEAAMATTFSLAGIGVALALSATLLYRILNMALFLPLGFFFYQKYLREG